MNTRFRLRISGKGGKARLAVEYPRGAKDKSPLTPPYDDRDQNAVLAMLEAAGSRRDDAPARVYREVGQKLFKALLPTGTNAQKGIQKVFQDALRIATASKTPLILQLQFDAHAVQQAALPWELAHDGKRHLVLEEAVHLNRYITYYGARKWPRPVDPLRVLLIISRPHDVPEIAHYVERDAVVKALAQQVQSGKVIIDVLETATMAELEQRLKNVDYHIVHFDGHGAVDPRTHEGVLVFEEADESRDLVTARQLADLLRPTLPGHSNVRLVMLSACQSAMIRGSSVFNSVAPALIRARIPAVVAMQFEILVASTVQFSGAFYDALARGESVSEAVAEGRRTIPAKTGDWFFPALYQRAAEGEGYLFSPEPQAHAMQRIEELRDLAQEWKSLTPKQQAEYEEGRPSLTLVNEAGEEIGEAGDVGELEQLLDYIETGMDFFDALQEYINTAQDLMGTGGDKTGSGSADSTAPRESAQPASKPETGKKGRAKAGDESCDKERAALKRWAQDKIDRLEQEQKEQQEAVDFGQEAFHSTVDLAKQMIEIEKELERLRIEMIEAGEKAKAALGKPNPQASKGLEQANAKERYLLRQIKNGMDFEAAVKELTKVKEESYDEAIAARARDPLGQAIRTIQPRQEELNRQLLQIQAQLSLPSAVDSINDLLRRRARVDADRLESWEKYEQNERSLIGPRTRLYLAEVIMTDLDRYPYSGPNHDRVERARADLDKTSQAMNNNRLQMQMLGTELMQIDGQLNLLRAQVLKAYEAHQPPTEATQGGKSSKSNIKVPENPDIQKFKDYLAKIDGMNCTTVKAHLAEAQ